MINLKLRDLENQELSVTLWDKYAEQMHAYILENDGNEAHVVLVIQFASVNNYRGKHSVCNLFDVTRLFINSEITEVVEFKKRYLDNPSLATSSSHGGSCMITSVEDEFINKTDFTNIAYINGITEVKYFVIVCTIKAICKDKLWYYLGCNLCKRSVETNLISCEKEDGSGDVISKTVVVCKNEECKDQEIYVVPRFRIPIRVQDSTGCVSLTLFDREAFSLLKISAKELVERLELMDVFDELPTEFDALLEKKYAFQIHILKFSIDNNVQYFGISKLTDDQIILQQLEKKMENDQNELSQSIDISFSELQSNNLSLKETVSYTGDNATPQSIVAKNNETTPLGKRTRISEEVNEVDDTTAFSSTKIRKPDFKEGNEDLEAELLIPKLEK